MPGLEHLWTKCLQETVVFPFLNKNTDFSQEEEEEEEEEQQQKVIHKVLERLLGLINTLGWAKTL